MSPSPIGVVGQTSSYTASEGEDGYTVTVIMGSGDCPSGCIDHHTWNYSVSHDGKVTLTSEEGTEIEPPADHASSDPATVKVLLLAGPVCPVERNPPDPNCAGRPVPNVAVVLRDPAGHEVDSGTADAQGALTFSVPGGAYYLEPAPVAGLMREPAETAFSVPGGTTVTVALSYDTGIR